MSRALFAQATGGLQGVHAVHPGKMRGYGAGFVRLQRADKMPLNGQIGQGVDFELRFLQVVFPEGPLASSKGFPNGRCRPGFAHGEQAYTGRRSACPFAGLANTILDHSQILGKQVHGR